MTLTATHCVASIPTYPICKHQHKPPRSLSRRILSRSNRVSNVKIPQSTSLTFEPRNECECFNLYEQQVPYGQAWAWQKSIVNEKKTLIQRNEDCSDSLFVLQHRPVYTLGTASSEQFLNFDVKDSPFDIYRTERGGEVTYHGPGQIVMYPIMNLRNHKMDLHWYLRSLEEVIIRALSETFCIKASRLEGLTGVWHGNQKLAAIGIRVSQWITYHGLALNVTTDLTPFRSIVPCGLRDCQVGSVRGLLKEFQSSADCERARLPDPDDGQLLDITCKSLIKEFSEVFQVRINHETTSRLELLERKPVNHLEEETN